LAENPWLIGPVGDVGQIADRWVASEAARIEGTVSEGGGLLPSMKELSCAGFDPGDLQEQVVRFYEQTDQFRLEVWSQWCPFVWPFGWLLSALFSRRLGQFAMPLRPLDTAKGIDSRVLGVHSGAGEQIGAVWLRNLRSTGQFVYSGWYGTAQVPNADRPSVRVTFPLPNGNVTVFLRPEVGPGGSLVLDSPLGGFGDNGAYLVVVDTEREWAWVRRAPIVERLTVGADNEGVLRTDHALDFRQLPVIRLHYRMDPIRAT
jgi:hypothetical protein